jgi:starch synthase
MKILFAASEVYPLVKTGGLADVAGALPLALAGLGLDMRVMLPAYRQVREGAGFTGKEIFLGDPFGSGEMRLREAKLPGSGLKLLLLDCPALFDRPGGPYQREDGAEWPDNDIRFAALAYAAAALARTDNPLGWRPDIIHANDWQTGLVPAYLEFHGNRDVKCVFTIHNLQYQGRFSRDILDRVLIPQSAFSPEGLEFYGAACYLKSGIFYADHITTVSRTYAEEIRTPAFGWGMEGILQARAAHLSGIVNGIDTAIWNPENDPHIACNYTAGSLNRKAQNKAALQAGLGLPQIPDAPLFGVVSRLAEQKGIDLVLQVIPDILAMGGQLAVLGTGDAYWEDALRQQAQQSPSVSAAIAYREELSHRIIAGSDMFLMPSRFEPCGLTQLYALGYGTAPIVRRTGGLADTVQDMDKGKEGTGFVFDEASAPALRDAITRAVDLYKNTDGWQNMQRRAMKQDFSWDRSARDYVKLYTSLLK